MPTKMESHKSALGRFIGEVIPHPTQSAGTRKFNSIEPIIAETVMYYIKLNVTSTAAERSLFYTLRDSSQKLNH
jgi:hypothetical protein